MHTGQLQQSCDRGVNVFVQSEPEQQEKFERWLSEINSSDGLCLLTAFAHMAQPKRTDADPEFVRTIVLQIYEVRVFKGSNKHTECGISLRMLYLNIQNCPYVCSGC